MSSNLLRAHLTCPRCGWSGETEIEATIDERGRAKDYWVGDRVDWLSGHRPPDGCSAPDGYVECAICGRDFFVCVRVANDQIMRVWVDETRPGYISG